MGGHPANYASGMDDDLHQLGEDLVTTSARIMRWTPKDGYSLSLASARILARLIDNGPTRISTLAALERSSQPTITNHVKRLEAEGLVRRDADAGDARVWVITTTDEGRRQMQAMRHQLGTNVEPYLAELTDEDRTKLREGLAVMLKLMSLRRH